MDEAHNFINQHDVDFQGISARSSRCATVMLSQNIPNYLWALGERGQALTDSLMGVLQTKIFCANSDPKTNQWAAEIFGKGSQFRTNSSTTFNQSGDSRSGGASEHLDYVIQPVEFMTLARGGPSNGNLVQTIIGQGGRRFTNGQTYIKTSFKQGEMK